MLIAAVLGMFSLSAQAQSTCTGKAQKESTSCTATNASAMALAKESPDIIVKTNEKTGVATFVKQEINAETGAVKETPVEYCKKEKAFINVAPKKDACCASGKTTATKTAKATKKVVTAKKAECCASMASKGCAGEKAEKASAREQAKEPTTKLVNNQQ